MSDSLPRDPAPENPAVILLPPVPPEEERESRRARWRRLARWRLHQGETWFWILFAILLLAAAILRSYRIDMPPVDYPTDRQKTNYATLLRLRDGASLLDLRRAWMELPLLAWIGARTAWIGALLGIQSPWTVARLWAWFFGVATVALAALGGWHAAGNAATPARRRRLALLFMAAMAFNPYHIFLSRLILTEVVTLFFQMAALAAFWMAYRRPQRIGYHVLFAGLFIFAGWTKIPALIWAPGFFVYYLFHPQIRWRPRLIGLAAFAVGVLLVFWLYALNPFTIFQNFSNTYRYFFEQANLWMSDQLWLRAFVSRTVLMLSLPGALLAIVGFLSAPWLFRITFIVFLLLFWRLLNLNTYNFCHAIIPGMALAAWGAHILIEAGSGERLRVPWRRWDSRLERLHLSARAGLALSFVLVLVVALYPLGPSEEYKMIPDGAIWQGLQVIESKVPKNHSFATDDLTGSLSYLSNRPDKVLNPMANLTSGYFYSIERFGEKPLINAARGWVDWASLPGEPNGMLLTSTPRTSLPPDELQAFVRLDKNPTPEPLPFEIEYFWVPRDRYDHARRMVLLKPGEPITIGIEWKNDVGAPLAGMRWSSAEWLHYIPVPVRQGGFAIWYGGVLNVPPGRIARAFYTFDIPEGFPQGIYAGNCYPQRAGQWEDPASDFVTFPFLLLSTEAQPEQLPIRREFKELYPILYDRPPLVWSHHWWFRNMRLQGYRTIEEQEYIFSAPHSPPGVYEFVIEGEGTPVSNPARPEDVWPKVEIYLPPDRERAVATVTIAGRSAAKYAAAFTAVRPFNSVLLRTRAGRGSGEPPLWTINFSPADYGKQVLTLRAAELALRRELGQEQGAVNREQ